MWSSIEAKVWNKKKKLPWHTKSAACVYSWATQPNQSCVWVMSKTWIRGELYRTMLQLHPLTSVSKTNNRRASFTLVNESLRSMIAWGMKLHSNRRTLYGWQSCCSSFLRHAQQSEQNARTVLVKGRKALEHTSSSAADQRPFGFALRFTLVKQKRKLYMVAKTQPRVLFSLLGLSWFLRWLNDFAP